MRYRVKDYTVDVYQDNVRVFLTVPSTLIEAYPSFTTEERRKVTEAIRLIIDETAGAVFCSSMQKDKIIQMQAQNNQDETTKIAIYFAIPTDKTIASTDQFTIEMDWGDEPSGLSPNDAHNLAQFFGLPEALPEEYQPMTEEEIKSINTDIWLGLYGYEVVKNTLHYKNFIDEVVTIDTYFNSGKTYADYGYASLWSAHDVTVDVNSNPIEDAEIYTYNPPVE